MEILLYVTAFLAGLLARPVYYIFLLWRDARRFDALKTDSFSAYLEELSKNGNKNHKFDPHSTSKISPEDINK